MTIQVIEVMTRDEAEEFRQRVERREFVDGRASARGSARLIKQNMQAKASSDETVLLVDELMSLLADHTRVRGTAFPKHFGRLTFNRYGPGDHYGLHTDSVWMTQFGQPHRSDLSFTLFLSDPDDYDGGELHIASGLGSPHVKLVAGQMVLYPTRFLHEVTEVKTGVRFAAIGWIESWISDPELRDLATKARMVEGLIESQPVPAFVKLMMHEVARDLERIGSR